MSVALLSLHPTYFSNLNSIPLPAYQVDDEAEFDTMAPVLPPPSEAVANTSDGMGSDGSSALASQVGWVALLIYYSAVCVIVCRFCSSAF